MKLPLPSGDHRVQSLLMLAVFLLFLLHALGVLSASRADGLDIVLNGDALLNLFEGRWPTLVAGLDFLCFVGVGSVLALLLPTLPPLTASLVTLAAMGPPFYIAWLHPVPPPAVPLEYTLLTMLLLFSVYVLTGYFIESRQRHRLAAVFGQYVPPELVSELARRPQDFSLDSEARELTVLFCDIKGFSAIAEQLETRELSELMNHYLTALTAVLHRHGATIDKYIGDAIMAFWGAPVADPDGPLHACLAALEMQRRLAKMQVKLKQVAGVELTQRVGVNTGVCTVGNMGSISKVNYTAIGDPVNLASRLEGVNKQYGTAILISEMTQQKVAGKVLTREVDRVVVMGKSEPVRIYELLDVADKSVPDKTKIFLDTFQEALKAYQERRWDEGIAYMEHAMTYWPNDPVCQMYIERMRLYQIHPPKPDWNGVFVLESK